MRSYLRSHGLIGEDVELFHPHTRDRKDLPVYRCRSTGVVFLDYEPARVIEHYVEKDFENDGKTSRTQIGEKVVSTATLEDAARRARQFRNLLTGRSVCDFGTGNGQFLREIRRVAAMAVGVELNREEAAKLCSEGIRIESGIDAYESQSLDVVTLFHVLEHLTDPVEALVRVRQRLKPGGRLVVEVPHARDFLVETLKSEAFKNFTYWSEHLVLHTRDSLEKVVRDAGFASIVVKGFQRYGLENHLYWLARGQPGGHQHWSWMADEGLHDHYAAMLQSIDQTDTLIATAVA